MNRHTLTLGAVISLVALAAIVGCSSSDNSSLPPDNSGGYMGRDGQDNSSGNSGMMGQPGSSGDNYSSDGERIFLSGVGTDGRDIARSAPNASGGSPIMSGGGCVSCHGADGRGSTIRMMAGTVIETPDITYDELIEEGFTDATIAAAIRDGVDEKGEQLDAGMPRWQMSMADVDATIAYLKVLSTQ
ncbi:MAG: c-type cytochrome [Coriobacteriia bacterium]